MLDNVEDVGALLLQNTIHGSLIRDDDTVLHIFKPILAFSMRLGALMPDKRIVKTKPSISLVSSTVPPKLQMSLMFLRSISASRPRSVTLSTASTAIGAKRLLCCDTTLEFKEVDALLIKLTYLFGHYNQLQVLASANFSW